MAVVAAVGWIGVLGGAGVASAQPPAFAQVSGSPFPAGGSAPRSVAFSSTGGLLATANYGSASVSVFSVAANGLLTSITGSPFATGSSPYSVTFSPSGGLLATANYASGNVSVFSVGPGGQLSGRVDTTLPAGSAPYSVAFSPSGGLLATANYGNNNVSVFSVAADGALTPVVHSPFATGSNPISVAFSPSGGMLATANYTSRDVSVFSVPAGGALTPVAGSPFATGSGNALSVAFSPSGGLLATGNFGGNVSVFSVAAGGALTSVTGSPFTTGGSQTPSVAFSPSGGLLATANYGTNNVSVFSVPADGALHTPVAGSPFATGSSGQPQSVAFSPSGGLLATANFVNPGSVSVFAPTGPLEIAKTADRGAVGPGEVLSYTITIRNAGIVDASGPVTDDLGGVLDKATFENATASTGSVVVDRATRQLTWDGTLAPGETATVHYSVRLHDSAHGLLFNGVSGPPGSVCTGTAGPELPCVVETAVVPPPAPGADLQLTKTASTDTAHPGSQVLYALAVRNHGSAAATGVTVEDPVPAGLFLHSAAPSQGSCTITASELRCRLGTLSAGSEVLVLVSATVAADASDRIVNEATVFGDQGDPHPANNTARSTITVTPLPPPPVPDPGTQPVSRLAVVKHVNHRTAVRGQKLRYTITVTNKGPDPAHNVKLIDTSRLPLRVLSIHSRHGHCHAGPPIGCALGTLRAGAHATVTITARARAVGRQINAAAATSTSWNPNPSASLATAKTRIIPVPRRPPPPPPVVTG